MPEVQNKISHSKIDIISNLPNLAFDKLAHWMCTKLFNYSAHDQMDRIYWSLGKLETGIFLSYLALQLDQPWRVSVLSAHE